MTFLHIPELPSPTDPNDVFNFKRSKLPASCSATHGCKYL